MRPPRFAFYLLLASLTGLGYAPAAGRAAGGTGSGARSGRDDANPAAFCQQKRIEAGPGRLASAGRRLPGLSSCHGTTLAALPPAALPAARPPAWRLLQTITATARHDRGVADGRSSRGPPARSAPTT